MFCKILCGINDSLYNHSYILRIISRNYTVSLLITPTKNVKISLILHSYRFPHWPVDKESTCNAADTGDKGLIPGLGRSPGEGNGNPLQ